MILLYENEEQRAASRPSSAFANDLGFIAEFYCDECQQQLRLDDLIGYLNTPKEPVEVMVHVECKDSWLMGKDYRYGYLQWSGIKFRIAELFRRSRPGGHESSDSKAATS